MLNRNASRIQTTGGKNAIYANQQEIAEQAAKKGTEPTLHRAVVMDVIVNPDELSDDYKQQIALIVNNPELVEVIPANAVIARLISTGQGLINARDTILFPFFSSHIMLPVQPGEVVYVIYEDYANLGNKLGYWITRPHGQGTIEDVNYTHNDRQYDARNNLGYWSIQDRQDITKCSPPNFQNGGGTDTTVTLTPIDDQNPYDVFAKEAASSKLITPEPVPRWHKRPQELVLQGSNNTLIMMGEDRFGHVSGSVDPNVNGNNKTDKKGFAGTIDLIVGRGRAMPSADNNYNSSVTNQAADLSVGPAGEQTPVGTAPRVIQNQRGSFETDKAPFRQKRSDGGRVSNNPKEGDPDFDKDAARILISMQTEADVNFGLSDIQYPNNSLKVTQPEASRATVQDISGSFNRSYVVQKGDHIRIVARKDADLGVNGSILLIKEGISGQQDQMARGDQTNFDTQEKDLAYIYITDDGIQVQAKKIYIGPSKDQQEPYVLWSKYAETIDNLQQQIRQLANNQGGSSNGIYQALTAIFEAVNTAATAGNVCPPNGPNPAVAAMAIAMKTIWENTVNSPNSNVQTHTHQGTNTITQLQTTNMNDNVNRTKHSSIIYGS